MLKQIFKEHSNMKKKITFELDFVFDIFQIQIEGVCGQFAYIWVLRRRVKRNRTIRDSRESELSIKNDIGR